jgi:hypothetical protein
MNGATCPSIPKGNIKLEADVEKIVLDNPEKLLNYMNMEKSRLQKEVAYFLTHKLYSDQQPIHNQPIVATSHTWSWPTSYQQLP